MRIRNRRLTVRNRLTPFGVSPIGGNRRLTVPNRLTPFEVSPIKDARQI